MEIGEISGCLEVVAMYDDIVDDIHNIERDCAIAEWNKFDNWRIWSKPFHKFYELDENETNLFNEHKDMPESFISKYLEHHPYLESPKLLFHKQRPKTEYELLQAYKHKELFGVRCNKCGRKLITDEVSFHCVKWQSCVGAECIKSNLKKVDTDYNKSLYEWKENTTAVAVLNTLIAKADELSTPLTYYSEAEVCEPSLYIAYISDIHLLHHVKYYESLDSTIKNSARSLYRSLDGQRIIIFAGDIASTKEATVRFYEEFVKQIKYERFIKAKNSVYNIKRNSSANIEKRIKVTESRIKRIDKFIAHIKFLLKDTYGFVFERFIKYKDTYYGYLSTIEGYQEYKMTKAFKNLHLSNSDIDYVDSQMQTIIDLEERCERYKYRLEWYDTLKWENEQAIEKYKCSMDEINLTKINTNTLHPQQKIFAVLGNHEYIEFTDTESAVEYYRTKLEHLGITLLHNSSYEGVEGKNNKYLIYGGTGFAKYNLDFNANNTKCFVGFNREKEIKETELFEKGYEKAFIYAKEHGMCFVCISHYPIDSCLNKYDKETIYFTGHDHRNMYTKNQDRVVYADNQIGYTNNNIVFKSATSGFWINPYAFISDGLYVTTIEEYLKFYRYIGESVGEGALLYKRCENNKANLYLVKRKGYYGFFIMCPSGKGKGISIVNGGLTKKITEETDMEWLCDNFDIVLNKYLSVLLPLRQIQETLSTELKELGLYGTIHGTIVDIDFYHHIMINPVAGTITLYYSPSFGMIQEIPSFEGVIDSMESKDIGIRSQGYFDELRLLFKSKREDYLISRISENYMIETSKMDKMARSEIRKVETTGGSYGMSRKVNPLQRLFTGHVLREFDIKLTKKRKK